MKPPRRAPLMPLVAACVLAGTLPAHGGQYRGPSVPWPGGPAKPFVPAPKGPGIPGPTTPARPMPMPPAAPAPTTPGPGGAVPATPLTGGPAATPDEVSWQIWWEFNKDPFVQPQTAAAGPTTGSDDFYIGRRRAVRAETLAPNAIDVLEVVVPALVELLEKERNRDVQTACMMALAKIGRAPRSVDLEALFVARLARDNQEVRETAALALGVGGQATALPLLLALLRDDPAGRKLCEREKVEDRTRAFAAYGLGLLARQSDDAATKLAAHDALFAVLDGKQTDRDLRVAATNAIGLLVDPEQVRHRRLAWQCVDELLALQDRGSGDFHVPVAIGRLLGRGDSASHRRCKEIFVAVLLDGRSPGPQSRAIARDLDRSNAAQQSAAIALGMLALPTEQCPADADVARALQEYAQKGVDRLARRFATMALGRIGGAANRQWLMTTWQRAHKNLERPWLALALGLIAARDAAAGKPDEALARMLVDGLQEASFVEVRSAFAVAIGLTGWLPALATLRDFLREHEATEAIGGYACVALGLLGEPAAAPLLGEVVDRSARRPFVLQQAAVGLGRLGDPDATPRLVALMARSESVAVLAALANAIGQIGDRRAIPLLVALTKDDEQTKLGRAFAAAALGGVCERFALPWNLPLSRDANYGAPVDTLSNGATGVLDIL
jgi:HEAT repeat protein